MIKSVGGKEQREEFFRELDRSGYLNAVKKYGRKTPKLKLCSTVVLDNLHPVEFVKRIVKE